jgi:hypothetical protein
MARLIMGEGIRSGDFFIPGQLFAFGSIVLHADLTGHLDQIDNFAPKHRIRFGNLEYIADAWGDLVLTGFTTPSRTLAGLDMPTLESSSNPIYGSTLAPRTASSQEGPTPSEDQTPSIVPAEVLPSTFEAGSGGRSQESISVEPFLHNAYPALTSHDEVAAEAQELPPARSNSISSPGVESTPRDQNPSLTSDDYPDPIEDPVLHPELSSACRNQGLARIVTAPVTTESGPEPSSSATLAMINEALDKF